MHAYILQSKLLDKLFEQKREGMSLFYVYSKEQRKVMDDVLSMLNPVTVDGAIYPGPSDEDVKAALELLKEAGITL